MRRNRGFPSAGTLASHGRNIQQPRRALEVINTVPADKLDHWLLYRRAEAELAIRMPEALATAQQALAGSLTDPRAKEKLAAYYDMLSRCMSAAGDIAGAIDQARLAIAHCTGGKFQQELTNRLASMQSTEQGHHVGDDEAMCRKAAFDLAAAEGTAVHGCIAEETRALIVNDAYQMRAERGNNPR